MRARWMQALSCRYLLRLLERTSSLRMLKWQRKRIDAAFLLSGMALWWLGWFLWFKMSGNAVAVAFFMLHGSAIVVSVIRGRSDE